ncbi:MAG: Holliday junction branch migration protein RuvA [Eubacteriales bacterium]
MFYYLKGIISVVEPNLAVVDCNGVGYACHTTNTTLSTLNVGEPHKLFTHCNIREDAFDIYGFSTKEELRCYQQLVAISGVGPKAAMMILSTVTPSQFMLGVVTGDEKMLTRAPGIGKKIAQRIILELKDKLAKDAQTMDTSSSIGIIATGGNDAVSEATAALSALGYSGSEIAVALKGADSSMTVEALIRHGLRAMVAN